MSSVRAFKRRERRFVNASDAFGSTTRFVVALALTGIGYAAWAGPPFRTDDPDVGDYGKLEVNLFFAQTLVADGRDGTNPGVELNYGAIENVQLHLLAPLAFSTPPGQAIIRGYGDTELGVKYRLTKEPDSVPSMAISPLLEIPTGDSKKGSATVGAKSLSRCGYRRAGAHLRLTAAADTGSTTRHNWRNYWFFGWQVQYELSDHWFLGGEIFYNTGEEIGQASSIGFNLGGIYDFDEHNHILFSAGKGLRNAAETNRVSSYVAYSSTY